MGPGSPLTVTTIRVRGRRELRAPGPLDAPCQAPLARGGSATPVWGSRWDGTEIPPWGRGWCGQTGPRAAQPGSSTRGNRGVLLLEGSEGRGSGGLVGPLLWLGWGEISCSLCPTLIMMVPLETRAPPATLGGDAPTQSLPTPALPFWTLGPPESHQRTRPSRPRVVQRWGLSRCTDTQVRPGGRRQDGLEAGLGGSRGSFSWKSPDAGTRGAPTMGPQSPSPPAGRVDDFKLDVRLGVFFSMESCCRQEMGPSGGMRTGWSSCAGRIHTGSEKCVVQSPHQTGATWGWLPWMVLLHGQQNAGPLHRLGRSIEPASWALWAAEGAGSRVGAVCRLPLLACPPAYPQHPPAPGSGAATSPSVCGRLGSWGWGGEVGCRPRWERNVLDW